MSESEQLANPEKEKLLQQVESIPIPYLLAIDSKGWDKETYLFPKYVMSGVSFAPLHSYFKELGLSKNLADTLMRRLWTAFLENSVATHPMSREPGVQYVLLDLMRSQPMVIAQAVHFFTQIAPEIINSFASEFSLKLDGWKMSDIMTMSIGGQIDTEDDLQKCPMHLTQKSGDYQGQTIFQNAPSSTEIIFGAVANKAWLITRRQIDKNIPLSIFDPEGEIKIGISSKGVEFAGRTYDAGIDGAEQHEQAMQEVAALKREVEEKRRQLSSEQLKKFATLRCEIPFTAQQATKLFADEKDDEIELSSQQDFDLAAIELIEGKSTVLRQIQSIDLSGMTKITNLIDTLSDEEASNFWKDLSPGKTLPFNTTSLKEIIKIGMQEFFAEWISKASLLFESIEGCSAFEFGGDGFKVLCAEGTEIELEHKISFALLCNDLWESLLGKYFGSLESAKGIFARFVTYQLGQGKLNDIMTKTLLSPKAEVKLIKYGPKMYEVRTTEDIEGPMNLIKKFYLKMSADPNTKSRVIYTKDNREIPRPMIIIPKEVYISSNITPRSYWKSYEVKNNSGEEYLIIVDHFLPNN